MQIFHSKTLNSIQDFFRFQHQENSRDSTESCVLKVGISCIPTIHCIRVVFWLVKKIFEGSIFSKENVTVNPKEKGMRQTSKPFVNIILLLTISNRQKCQMLDLSNTINQRILSYKFTIMILLNGRKK